jgi:hypothetical protein
VSRYEVYATRWDDPHIIEELIPARDLEFSMPLSDHGECSFTARVESGRSFWRSALTQYLSGVLVARDGVPVWQGWLVADDETGDREFTFRAVEWGFFFATCPAVVKTWSSTNDCVIFRDLVDSAQVVAGQDVKVQTGDAVGASFSDRTVNAWDDTTTESEFRSVSDAQGGPEWYFGTTGTLENPVRQLYLGDRLGTTDPAAMLEFVEDTAEPTFPGPVPTVTLLGNLFPGQSPVVPTRRAGGNVIAKARLRQSNSATSWVGFGAGDGPAQYRVVKDSPLLGQGWPKVTRSTQYSDIKRYATLQRRVQADLDAAEGFATGYSLVTLESDPDWTLVPRGSSVLVSLDTDVYAGPRPLEFSTRVLNTTVRVPDDGEAQVQWDVATVQEV